MNVLYHWLRETLSLTLWGMEKPTHFGAFHLIWLATALPLAIFAAWKLRNAGEKANRRILFGVGLFLLITEVYKQLLYGLCIGAEGYDWWIFPFQLCSVPMYLCLIVPFLKPGKVQRGMYHFMLSFNMLGGVMAMVEISGLSHEYVMLTLHAFVWHTLLVFLGLYLGLSRRTTCKKADYLSALKVFCVLCAVAFAINLILRKPSGGGVNMFYIGPSNSPLMVFKTIAEKFGWYVSTLLYIPTLSLGAFLIFSLFRLAKRNAKAPTHV